MLLVLPPWVGGLVGRGCLLSPSAHPSSPPLHPSLHSARSSLRCKQDDDSPYRSSVLLPSTSFSQRANSATREPELQAFWNEQGIYDSLAQTNPGEPFVLHDGPPYANGDLHTGHAMNKILKDMINKYQTLQGRRVSYVPGWDCHGLPIELKVLQGMKSKERQGLTPVQLRKKAASFAVETMEKQRASFERYGVWGNFAKPYLTLQPEYEAAQIRVFGQMYLKGHIYRGRKPVHWSPSSRTALAEAELEYPDKHTSASIYVGFNVVKPSACLEPYEVLPPLCCSGCLHCSTYPRRASPLLYSPTYCYTSTLFTHGDFISPFTGPWPHHSATHGTVITTLLVVMPRHGGAATTVINHSVYIQFSTRPQRYRQSWTHQHRYCHSGLHPNGTATNALCHTCWTHPHLWP